MALALDQCVKKCYIKVTGTLSGAYGSPPNSGILEIVLVEFGILRFGIRIALTIGIQNPSSTDKES